MKSASLINLCLFLIFLACSDEDPTTSVAADFDVIISGEAPNASVEIVNRSSGATNYAWVLKNGTNVEKTYYHTPTSFTIDKEGELTIELTVTNGSEDDVIYKTFKVH